MTPRDLIDAIDPRAGAERWPTLHDVPADVITVWTKAGVRWDRLRDSWTVGDSPCPNHYRRQCETGHPGLGPFTDANPEERARRIETLRHRIALGDLQDTLATFEGLGRAAERALGAAAGEHDTPEAMYVAVGRAIADWAREEPHVTNLRYYARDGLPALPVRQ